MLMAAAPAPAVPAVPAAAAAAPAPAAAPQQGATGLPQYGSAVDEVNGGVGGSSDVHLDSVSGGCSSSGGGSIRPALANEASALTRTICGSTRC